jgi:hypothetical protein
MVFRLIFLCALSALTSCLVAGEITKSPLEATGRQASAIQSKRVTTSTLQTDSKTALTQQRFPMQSWSKHFSSVGGKRANVKMASKEPKTITKTQFKTEIRDRKSSRFSKQRARVEKNSGISSSDKALIVEDSQTYAMQLQNPALFRELGKHLSLQDINRFQFRRNHSSGAVPVQKAGLGEK